MSYAEFRSHQRECCDPRDQIPETRRQRVFDPASTPNTEQFEECEIIRETLIEIKEIVRADKRSGGVYLVQIKDCLLEGNRKSSGSDCKRLVWKPSGSHLEVAG